MLRSVSPHCRVLSKPRGHFQGRDLSRQITHLLGIIRRWHLRDQIPIREIARRLDSSRNTVRRHLRSETIEPSYAERRSTGGLDKYSVQLSGWLKAETTKPRKQRYNLKQIHEDLKELGYQGSYHRVAAFARQWKAGQTEWGNSASKRTAQPQNLIFSDVITPKSQLLRNPVSSLMRLLRLSP
jgi:AraC-like DNA-binding protein